MQDWQYISSVALTIAANFPPAAGFILSLCNGIVPASLLELLSVSFVNNHRIVMLMSFIIPV